MANEEYLEILKKGVKVWNEWREKNPAEIPNLIKADLSRANLIRADLSRANLILADLLGANLAFANLSDANLMNANLAFANLLGANLMNANLLGANLSDANLNNANLSEAYLFRTIFKNTDLKNTNFKNSHLGYSIISDCDLVNALNLESTDHNFPSTIGIETIFKSKGKIPLLFLKGCGIPKDVIKTILPLAKGWPIRFYTCFISYSVKDKRFAERIKNNLEAKNIRCWFFPDDAVWGRDIEENIDLAIKDYDKLIVICSENSLNSEPVIREIDRALQKEQSLKKKHKATKRVLFPVIIDDYFYEEWKHPLKPLILRIVYGDFRDWENRTKYKKAFDKLLKALQK